MAFLMNVFRQRRQDRRQRIYRNRMNPLLHMDDTDLYNRYRLDRAGIAEVVALVGDDVAPVTGRSYSLSAEVQVLATLRYLGGNSLQQDIADTFGVTQPTVSRCVRQVVKTLERRLGEYVFFPQGAERLKVINGLFAVHQFPGVVGLIDGTHVRVIPPPGRREPEYVNRKGWHSINVQCVTNHRGELLNIDASWPGSCHDAFILRRSVVWDGFENGRIDGLLLGDAGYPLKPWLMTPYANPRTPSQRRFNVSHKRTRVAVEQAFGRWKNRCRILKDMRVDIEHAPSYIAACAIIHNIATRRNLPEFPNEDGDDEEDIEFEDVQAALAPYYGDERSGDAVRNTIATRHFP